MARQLESPLLVASQCTRKLVLHIVPNNGTVLVFSARAWVTKLLMVLCMTMCG